MLSWVSQSLFVHFISYWLLDSSTPELHLLTVYPVGLTSRNAGSVRTRTVGSALYNMCVQASNIIASNVSLPSAPVTSSFLVLTAFQIYRTDDAPHYRTGNKVILAIIVWSALLMIAIKFYYAWRNKTRDTIWNAMSPAERDEYLRTTSDRGNKRLDFRFAH